MQRYFPKGTLDHIDSTWAYDGSRIFGGGILTDSLQQVIDNYPKTVKYRYHQRQLIFHESTISFSDSVNAPMVSKKLVELTLVYRTSLQCNHAYKKLLRDVPQHCTIRKTIRLANVYSGKQYGLRLFFSDTYTRHVMEIQRQDHDKTMRVTYH